MYVIRFSEEQYLDEYLLSKKVESQGGMMSQLVDIFSWSDDLILITRIHMMKVI